MPRPSGGQVFVYYGPSSETPLRPRCALTCVPSVIVLHSFRAVSWAWGAVPTLHRKPREVGSVPVLFVVSLHCLHSVRRETCAQ